MAATTRNAQRRQPAGPPFIQPGTAAAPRASAGATLLDSREIAVYLGAGEARGGWRAAVAAFLLTAVLFALLPFSALLGTVTKPDLVILPVSTVHLAPPPPRLRIESEPVALPTPVQRARPQPRLDLPPPVLPVRLAATLDLATPDFAGDFKLDIGAFLRPHGPAPPVVAASSLFPVSGQLGFRVLTPAPEDRELAQGGGPAYTVEELDRTPRPTLQVPPVYPYRARTGNIEGFVEVQFNLTPEGRVTDVTVMAAEPADTFNEAARDAVRRWRFEPGTRNGRPVSARMQVRLRFELK